MRRLRRIVSLGLCSAGQSLVLLTCAAGSLAALFFHVTVFDGLGIGNLPLSLLTVAFFAPYAVAWYAVGIIQRHPGTALALLMTAAAFSMASGWVAASSLLPAVVFWLAGPALVAAALAWGIGILLMPRPISEAAR